MSAPAIVLRPQPGKQELFLSTPADIAIYGGAAGGGKSWALLLEPLRHIHVPGFACAMFRREAKQFRDKGGLWDESEKIYPLVGGIGREPVLRWTFPSGAGITGFHLEHEGDKLSHQGKQYALQLWDELTHFTEGQFFYLLSRLRSTCGVRPYVRATCNPDPDSWVAWFIAWWIGEDGLPIEERCGRLRWFARDGDQFVWGDSVDDVRRQAPHLFVGTEEEQAHVCLSVTFISAKLDDNPALTRADPAYRGKLNALSAVDRARLKDGNWKVRAAAGLVFKRHWFGIVDKAPPNARRVRFWDLAATAPAPGKDPDFTAGCLMAEHEGQVFIEDMRRERETPLGVQRLVKTTAEQDGRKVRIRMEQEPGSSGVNTIDLYQRTVLRGYVFAGVRSTGSKAERADPLSAAAEAGNVFLVRGVWNEAFLREAENFPPPKDKGHDDQVDAAAGAFNELMLGDDPVARLRNMNKW
jgi:predicted phage terminase large subunit-like protein